MKHGCHCHLHEQLKNFKAGKLGLLGGLLIVGHLLFHVAECLVIPVIIAGLSHHDAEAIEEISRNELAKTTLAEPNLRQDQDDFKISFVESLKQYQITPKQYLTTAPRSSQ